MSKRQLSESEKVVLQRAFEIVSSLRGDGRMELRSGSATPETGSTGRYSREDGARESTGIQNTPRAASYKTTPRVAITRRRARSKFSKQGVVHLYVIQARLSMYCLYLT